MQQDNRNTDKIRKSEAQKRFEEADNAGRFAGDDADAQSARAQAAENIRQDTGSTQEERNKAIRDNQSGADENIRPEQSNAFKAEAQNINKGDADRLDGESETERARNKATQGIREDRDTGTSDDRSR